MDITSCLIVDVIPDHVCASSQKRASARTPRPLVWDTEIETETRGVVCQQGPNLPPSENVVIECGGKYLTSAGANSSVSGPEEHQSLCQYPQSVADWIHGVKKKLDARTTQIQSSFTCALVLHCATETCPTYMHADYHHVW